jgi:hypothetical protein
MSRHRTVWDGGPSTWRQKGGSRRACVRWRSWVLTNAPHSKGTLPVYWAATLGHVETVKVLVEVGADTEELMTVDGMETKITALQLAVCQGKLAVCQGKLGAIRELAQYGANVDDDGNKAVHLTALNDQVDVDGNWERICQPRLSRLEQVCSS